ncbi:MAG: isoaspartyl peptidase/L-asparaginase [Maricaulaceae bacterium]
MTKYFTPLIAISTLSLANLSTASADECPAGGDYALAIHGGAGVILRKNLDAKTEAAYRQALNQALDIGQAKLAEGTPALDVVEAVIVSLENDSKFNAGKGAVFSDAGLNELDAAIMDGSDRDAGTIAGVTTVKNPIKLARAVMDNSVHVMLQSDGAEEFAKTQGLEIVDQSYFFNSRRWKQLKAKQKRLKEQKDGFNRWLEDPQTKYGTVGAVVKDSCGNLAAGTSTGGLTAKKFGRVGDTPIIGAGTYADNRYCAVSATGTGEFFIRATVARDVCVRQEFTDESIQASADHLIHTVLPSMGGDGGIITMDKDGQIAFSFNTDGMYRGSVTPRKRYVAIFKNETSTDPDTQ